LTGKKCTPGAELEAGSRLEKTIKVIIEVLAEVAYSVIPAKDGIQNRLKILDSGPRFACPE
jgi:hypothetical protein